MNTNDDREDMPFQERVEHSGSAIDRREFLRNVTAGTAGAATVFLSGCGRQQNEHVHEHDQHAAERARLFQEKLVATAEFRRDPQRWWHANKERLLVPRNVQHVLKCIDEGVDPSRIPGFTFREESMDMMSLPGSGITLDAEHETTPREREIIRATLGGHVVGVCNHRSCASCEGVHAPQDGTQYARDMAMDLKTRYLGQIDRLTRLSWHPAIASVLRYSATYRNTFPRDAAIAFDTSMWVFNGRGHEERRVKLAKLPIQIVFGPHGNGSLFTTEQRFMIPYIYDPSQNSRQSIEDEIMEAARQARKERLVEPIPLPV